MSYSTYIVCLHVIGMFACPVKQKQTQVQNGIVKRNTWILYACTIYGLYIHVGLQCNCIQPTITQNKVHELNYTHTVHESNYTMCSRPTYCTQRSGFIIKLVMDLSPTQVPMGIVYSLQHSLQSLQKALTFCWINFRGS